MVNINWNHVKHFKQDEFSENPKYAEPQLIYALDLLRKRLDKRIYPSPVKGALARFSGGSSSQHYAVDRLSTGIDVFCEGIPMDNFLSILSCRMFNGIGVYLSTTGIDSNPWVMFHLDIRANGFTPSIPWVWFVFRNEEGDDVYIYPQQNSKNWKLLKSDIMYEPKKKIETASKIS